MSDSVLRAIVTASRRKAESARTDDHAVQVRIESGGRRTALEARDTRRRPA
ncbi:MAG TPA: hypothetical protein VM434_01075 [Beijerinckiaceae bacterium]|nr:hypothetical protein [Beijerinckiaceae bacterium]